MAREIILCGGSAALVDDADFADLSAWRWRPSGGYAIRVWQVGKRQRRMFMHRQIFPPPPGLYVDHINGDKLDNRRENLRHCTSHQNCFNRGPQANNSCGFKGVRRMRQTKIERYSARIQASGREENLGVFLTADDAARAYDAAAIRLHGEFARLNFPDDPTLDAPISQTTRCVGRTGFRGVCAPKDGRRFCARIGVNGAKLTVGWADTGEEAARLYDAAARQHYGELAILNFPDEPA